MSKRNTATNDSLRTPSKRSKTEPPPLVIYHQGRRCSFARPSYFSAVAEHLSTNTVLPAQLVYLIVEYVTYIDISAIQHTILIKGLYRHNVWYNPAGDWTGNNEVVFQAVAPEIKCFATPQPKLPLHRSPSQYTQVSSSSPTCKKLTRNISIWCVQPTLPPGLYTRNIQEVYTNEAFYTAIDENGESYMWGDSAQVSYAVERLAKPLRNVANVVCTRTAFAALLRDGTVTTWGHRLCGGDSQAVQHLLQNVADISTTNSDFAALTTHGQVIIWGLYARTMHQTVYRNIQSICATRDAFVLLTRDSNIHFVRPVFFNSLPGIIEYIPYSTVRDVLCHNVRYVFSTQSAYAALLIDGRVITWGAHHTGGNGTGLLKEDLRNIVTIHTTTCSFAAVRSDGRVFVWGKCVIGTSHIPHFPKVVRTIHAVQTAFAIVTEYRDIVLFGHSNSSHRHVVPKEIRGNVRKLHSTNTHFIVETTDRRVIVF